MRRYKRTFSEVLTEVKNIIFAKKTKLQNYLLGKWYEPDRESGRWSYNRNFKN
jgi:hypothetical protein